MVKAQSEVVSLIECIPGSFADPSRSADGCRREEMRGVAPGSTFMGIGAAHNAAKRALDAH
jgi:hypothetical protein